MERGGKRRERKQDHSPTTLRYYLSSNVPFQYILKEITHKRSRSDPFREKSHTLFFSFYSISIPTYFSDISSSLSFTDAHHTVLHLSSSLVLLMYFLSLSSFIKLYNGTPLWLLFSLTHLFPPHVLPCPPFQLYKGTPHNSLPLILSFLLMYFLSHSSFISQSSRQSIHQTVPARQSTSSPPSSSTSLTHVFFSIQRLLGAPVA